MPEEKRNPYQSLATAIILQAVKDYKKGNPKVRLECKEFFQSQWFELLCEAALLNCDAAREALGIEMPPSNKSLHKDPPSACGKRAVKSEINQGLQSSQPKTAGL